MHIEDLYLYGVLLAFAAFGIVLFAVQVWSRARK